jgi:hypothetical protein
MEPGSATIRADADVHETLERLRDRRIRDWAGRASIAVR